MMRAADGSVRAPARWAPLAIVVALIALVVGGGQLLAAAVTTGGGGELEVGADVRLRLPPGWDVESVTATPPAARLHRGPVVLDVRALAPEARGPAVLADRYIAQQLRPALSQLVTAAPEMGTLANGVPAVRIWYVGTTTDGLAVEGVVTTATGQRSSAIFDASAPRDELVTVAEDLRAIVDHAVVA